jgi:amino-acid N-acetyltransferase
MPIEDIPQLPTPDIGLPKFKLDTIPFRYEGESDFPIRKATVSDVKGMLELINGFAGANLMLPRGPKDLFEHIRDFVVATEHETEQGQETPLIIACGGLHILWKNLAEVRSMAIHPNYQHKGLGRKLVEFMKTEAVQLGIKYLYTFTLAEEFFKMLGFRLQEKEELPSKLWDDCSRCPKFFKCDEVGMVLEL